MFSKKFSSNIRRKKRMIISSIILLIVFLTTGYAAFSTNLGINGTLTVDKYDHTLYGVLEKAAKKGAYAKEYTGEHQDSMAGVGTEKIYHWYANDTGNTTAQNILNQNNVIFANHCWQMIRTTDTGGVKMIYNGEPVNNQCLNTRGNHVGYASRTTQSMSPTYYYGTSYNYDKTNNLFSLDGDIATGTIKTGQFTCLQTTSTGTCTTLYLVDTLSSGTTYYVLPLNSNSHYSQFGTLQFNQNYNSPAYVGYMYNTVYNTDKRSYSGNYMNSTSFTLNPNYYYSETIDYGNINANKYTLINPQLVSSVTNTSDLVGKYVIRYNNLVSNSSVFYVAAIDTDGITANCYTLSLGNTDTSMMVGDSYTDNGNGTYTINNPTLITYAEWYNGEYLKNNGKYMCRGSSNTCSKLNHIVGSSSQAYYYVWASSDNYKYAENVSYASGTYTLTGDIKEVWDFTNDSERNTISTHHFSCFSSGTSCADIKYVTYINDYGVYYSLLDGESNISAVLNKTLNDNNVNQVNSVVKTGVDAWYKRYLEKYSANIEDTIFCNDRSIKNLGGWNQTNGSIRDYLQFNNYNYNNSSLSCTNITDKFSLNNNKAKLTYPVGLITFPETYLYGNQIIRTTGKAYYSISPNGIGLDSNQYVVPQSGGFGASAVTNSYGVRPVISLKPGTEYASGTGSMSDPYIVDVPMATLTINYKSDTGATLHESYVETMPVGASYSVTSPIISGYTTSQPVVSNTMGKYGATINVLYYPES